MQCLEAAVAGTGVDQVRERKLLNAAQALKRWGVNHSPDRRFERYEPVNGVANLYSAHWRTYVR